MICLTLSDMFRLPVCPHCGTIYRYKETSRIMRSGFLKSKDKKKNVCYHCKKSFRTAYLPGVLIPLAIWLALNITTNLIMLSRMDRLNLALMFITTVVYMALAFIALPFFIRFVPEEKINNKRNNKKNENSNISNKSKKRK